MNVYRNQNHSVGRIFVVPSAAVDPDVLAGLCGKKAAQQPPHVRALGRLAFILAALILCGAVAGFIPRLRQRREAQDVIAALATTTVTLVSPEPGKADAGLLLPAEVEPMLEASIFAQVNGYLTSWNVVIGAHVTASPV